MKTSKDRKRAENLTGNQAMIYMSKKLNEIQNAGFAPIAQIIRHGLFVEKHDNKFWNDMAKVIAEYAVVVTASEVKPVW